MPDTQRAYASAGDRRHGAVHALPFLALATEWATLQNRSVALFFVTCCQACMECRTDMAIDFEKVVIVGGGTAGWLSAAYLAARRPELQITLVEAPDIPTIGVGEGSWPTMRETLRIIGIPESQFLLECDASFKQGSRFDGWRTGGAEDSYLHPFTPPIPGDVKALITAWKQTDGRSFAELATPQAAVCMQNLAPRQRSMPDYAAALNYGYHFDAGKFARLLSRHAVNRLGVTHIRDQVTDILSEGPDRIAAVILRRGGQLSGDFFLDCTGMAARLIGEHYGTAWIDRSDVLFNDRALAVQVETQPDSPIASQTIGTAHKSGWLWDIALPTRRGIGCIYSSQFTEDAEAERTLKDYVATNLPWQEPEAIVPRKISFRTGHRESFWRGNCVAIGLSAGFIEPLEASAIVLVELSLKALADSFPVTREALPAYSERFNKLFHYRWERVVDFLKLHYVLSQRSEPYWKAHRDPASIPPSLACQLQLWRDHPPTQWDFPQVDEMFSAASQQYVLYGMGFAEPLSECSEDLEPVQAQLAAVREKARALTAAMPTNRTYLDALRSTPPANPREGEFA